MKLLFAGVFLLLAALPGASADSTDGWRVFYENGFRPVEVNTWQSSRTRSEKTEEGLRIVDATTEKDSGRLYSMPWKVPAQGAEAQARVRCIACSAPWGVSLSVADGVHEEGVTLYPDRVELSNARVSVPFVTTDRFHTYRIRFGGTDIQVWADGQLLIDGKGKFTAPAYGARSQLSFGAGSSAATGEAIWQSVRYRGAKVTERSGFTAPKALGLAIQVGKTISILPNQTYTSLFKLADGSLVVGNRRSHDGGKHWTEGAAIHTGAYQFPDGEVVQLGFTTRGDARPGYFRSTLARFKNAAAVPVQEEALFRIPEATGGTGDNGEHFEGPCADHAIVPIHDGSLLAALYGYFKSDTVLCPTFPAEWKLYKYRTFVARSTDRGKTWQYLSTVAYDPSVGLESFCEPDLLRLPNGEILCFMRTGGSGGKYTPLYLSRSRDDGKHWSKPKPIADRGVWPNACRMHSGILACTYGRPGNWLCFSTDGGVKWQGHFCFYEGQTSSYNTVEEVAPDTLLVVYDRQNIGADGNAHGGMAGTYVTVKRLKR